MTVFPRISAALAAALSSAFLPVNLPAVHAPSAPAGVGETVSRKIGKRKYATGENGRSPRGLRKQAARQRMLAAIADERAHPDRIPDKYLHSSARFWRGFRQAIERRDAGLGRAAA